MKILIWLFFPTLLYAQPWSISEKAPVIEEGILRFSHSWDPRFRGDDIFWNQRFEYGYAFYQATISRADGSRCGMYPTCSDYAYQTLQKHGPLIGGVMAADRFMRSEDQAYYPPITKYGRTRLYDPVANNDFWFTK
ncbi:MAG: membrane protein insertion efficiency factor YidD [Deltaproteobacteria bacterium]|nr:membrane protein insertion efficiency factor YidD [Deltaproteobacteria bacterium]